MSIDLDRLIIDAATQAFDERTGAFLPTGATTALLGAPLLLWLLSRMRANATASAVGSIVPGARFSRPEAVLGDRRSGRGRRFAGPVVGRNGVTWAILGIDNWEVGLPSRIWCVLDAFAGGALAAGAGTLLQRATGNPMASPDILGLGAAVMAGFAVALVVTRAPGLGLLLGMGVAPPRASSPRRSRSRCWRSRSAPMRG